jgi:hypothetical protein
MTFRISLEETMGEISETNRPRTLRRFGALVAGFFTIIIITAVTDPVMHATGIFPTSGQPMSNSLWLLSTAYRLVYGVLGCYIAARLAPDHPMRHAMTLGVVGLVLSIAGAVLTWNLGPGYGPHWYPLALIAITIPSAWLGAKLHGERTS